MFEKFLLAALDHLIPCRNLLFQVHNGTCLHIQLVTKPDKKLTFKKLAQSGANRTRTYLAAASSPCCALSSCPRTTLRIIMIAIFEIMITRAMIIKISLIIDCTWQLPPAPQLFFALLQHAPQQFVQPMQIEIIFPSFESKELSILWKDSKYSKAVHPS